MSLDRKSLVEETSQLIIQNDVQFITTSMMSGLINDNKPNSLYDFLLEKRVGATVY